MKIVAINGSQRKTQGFTQFLLEKMGEGIRSAGGELEIIRLSEKKINECIACDYCQKEIGRGCIFKEKDDVSAIFEKIASSDMVIYATPVYVFQMSSLLKKLLERFYGLGNSREFNITKSGLNFHYVDEKVCGKKFAVLITCDNMERETTLNIVNYFKTFSRFLDAECAGIVKRNFAWYFLKNKESAIFKEVVNGFVQAGKELVTTGKFSPGTVKVIEKNALPIPMWLLTLLKKTKGGKTKVLENIKKFKEGSR